MLYWYTQCVPRTFVRGVSTNSVADIGQRERGSGGGSPLVWGSGGSCNLVQEISFHVGIFFCWYFKTVYDDNQFICCCQCKTIANLSSFRILLSFSEHLLGVGVLNSTIFNSFNNRVEFGTILEGLRNFEGGLNTPPPSVRHWTHITRMSHLKTFYFFDKVDVSTQIGRNLALYISKGRAK